MVFACTLENRSVKLFSSIAVGDGDCFMNASQDTSGLYLLENGFFIFLDNIS